MQKTIEIKLEKADVSFMVTDYLDKQLPRKYDGLAIERIVCDPKEGSLKIYGQMPEDEDQG